MCLIKMGYHCEITGEHPDINLSCGYTFSYIVDNEVIQVFKTNFVISFSPTDSNSETTITDTSGIMTVRYKLQSNNFHHSPFFNDGNNHNCVELKYPYESYILHNTSCLNNFFLIELVITEFYKNRIIFVFEVIDTCVGAKGPHYNGPVLQYFYLNKNLEIIQPVSNYDCSYLANINKYFNTNIKSRTNDKLSCNYKLFRLTNNKYLGVSSVYYFLIDIDFYDDNYCSQVYSVMTHSTQLLHRWLILSLINDVFDPEKNHLCTMFTVTLIDVQLEYYQSVIPSYHLLDMM